MNSTFWLWFLYALAQLLHILKVAYDYSRDKHTPLNSIWQYFRAFVVPIVVRIALATAVFLAWWDHPTMVNDILARFGVDLGAVFPLNRGTAFLYGYLSDSMIDFITSKVPFLQGQIPAAPVKT